MNTINLFKRSAGSVLAAASLFCANLSWAETESEQMEIDQLVSSTQKAHNLESWWGKEVVSAKVEVIFGGSTVVDGEFLFEAHGPRARYDRADGVSILFDGSTAWVSPASAKAEQGRFHVLTWPWFIIAPFKMQGDGIYLSDLKKETVGDKEYMTLLQTFGESVGDTPEDWYRFYIDPETSRIEAMSYIVTYGRDLQAANQQPSIVKYLEYTSDSGPVVSGRYELWKWDATNSTYVGSYPKGTVTVSEIEYTSLDEVSFEVPNGARELPLK